MKRLKSIQLLLAFLLLFILCYEGWTEQQKEILTFDAKDTLEVLRYKIKQNNYNFEVGHNWVFDMTPEQKKEFFSRRPVAFDRYDGYPVYDGYSIISDDIGPLADYLGKTALPSSFDWRNVSGKSYIGAVRDQGFCGSCYAFGAAAAAEGTYNYAKGLYNSQCADFSESFIAWCLGSLPEYSSNFGGCSGADYSFSEVKALVDYGIINESKFPYIESDPGPCTHMDDTMITFKAWHRIPCGDIDAIKTAIKVFGVVDASVMVDSGFEAYSSGIFENSNTSCSSSPCYYTPSNHAVALVGWDDNEGVFILRNSWGPTWGESGYMKIKYGSAVVNCALAYLEYSSTSQPATIRVTSPNGKEKLKCGATQSIKWTYSGSVGKIKIEYTTDAGNSWKTIISSVANTGTYSWTIPNENSTQCKIRISQASTGTPSDQSDSTFTIAPEVIPILSVSRTSLSFAGVLNSSVTGSQGILIDNTGTGDLNWTASSSSPWLQVSPSSGVNSGYLSVSINSSGLTEGTYTGVLTITAPGATNSPKSINITLTIYSASQDSAPFGELSTPTNGAEITGSIPITGWVLDDVEVTQVKIYVNNTYTGDAVLVEGTRPDVEHAFPGYPKNFMAGWGYMLLSNSLPNKGNGTYTISAKAIDTAGHNVTLGSSTIHIDNASSQKPFGAIDTPAQGGTASGKNYINWGWVLTPLPNSIPVNGTTINVLIDGVNIGHPVYNVYRDDIADLFPSLNNSNGAIGYIYIDTTLYKNGLHTIQWVVTDSASNSEGIGSRYFYILN